MISVIGSDQKRRDGFSLRWDLVRLPSHVYPALMILVRRIAMKRSPPNRTPSIHHDFCAQVTREEPVFAPAKRCYGSGLGRYFTSHSYPSDAGIHLSVGERVAVSAQQRRRSGSQSVRIV
ncbi:unnamed protein product [Mycena citricolor]|uniref:Uncharacterized protein n=1 Tax=Mycena citricolor TaxID=2018698 RepID=A0AAD2HD29_9AGAR|nr:unnamed protein product [Mycena citricolor]